MKEVYFDTVVLIERLHRLFLEVIKTEIERFNIRDINNIQAIILYNIGKNHLTIGELSSRGYYLRSNVSYNLKKMIQNNYLVHEQSIHDRRSSIIKLTKKGLEFYHRINLILDTHLELAKNNQLDNLLPEMIGSLKQLENFWTSKLSR